MRTWLARCWKLLDVLIACGLAAMVVLVFANVVLRYAFNTGIASSEELSRWLFVWVILLGAVVALRERGHMGTEVLVDRLPPAARKSCVVLAHLLVLGILALMLKGTWSVVLVNLDARAPATNIPMSVLYAPGVIFSALALLIVATDLVAVIAGVGKRPKAGSDG